MSMCGICTDCERCDSRQINSKQTQINVQKYRRLKAGLDDFDCSVIFVIWRSVNGR